MSLEDRFPLSSVLSNKLFSAKEKGVYCIIHSLYHHRPPGSPRFITKTELYQHTKEAPGALEKALRWLCRKEYIMMYKTKMPHCKTWVHAIEICNAASFNRWCVAEEEGRGI